MLFCSFIFLLLLMPVTLLGYRLLPERGRLPFLLAVSVLFYGWASPLWILLLAFSMVLNWGGALLMTRGGRRRRWVFVLTLALNLLPLVWFKYAGFLRDTWNSLAPWPLSFATPPLPAGISFFTFQAMSYLIDVWRGKAKVQRRFTVFAVYLSLFPQLVAGPIVRYTDLEAQLLEHPRPTGEQLTNGLRRFCAGLAKKLLLADSVGRFWGLINADFAAAGTLGAWLGLLAFSFQIFFDFSGYSDMALGLGECLGLRMPENFLRPYTSASITEFWRRWHISLSSWFKEYVYIPLGGSHCARWRRDVNMLIVWALTGLWHGAGWHFVLWGLYFAVLLVAEKRLLLGRAWYERLPHALRQGVTFLLVMLGWGLFSGFGTPLLTGLSGGYGASSPETLVRCAAFAPLLLLCACISFLPVPARLRGKALPRLAAPVLMLLCLAALAAQGYAPFVYFQF